jgi:hypothetical protein
MKWIDTFYQEARSETNDPPVHTFVFDRENEAGDSSMVRIPDHPLWPYAPFLYGEYHPGPEPFQNDHLGNQVCIIGELIMDRLFTRLSY